MMIPILQKQKLRLRGWTSQELPLFLQPPASP